MRKNIYIDQQTFDRLSALAEVYGSDNQTLHTAINQLYAAHFPGAADAAQPEEEASGADDQLREGLVVVETEVPLEKARQASHGAARVLAGQTYIKSNYGDFYTVTDGAKSRALEGRFCEQTLFPVAERFASYGGTWTYYYDEASGSFHGMASINGEDLPESVTNGWYAMVLYLDQHHPEAGEELPHDPHPSYSGDS